mgnify:CR=1 FL=1
MIAQIVNWIVTRIRGERERAFVPFWQTVSRKAALGCCPNCGSFQQMGPRDRFPKTYICGRCGFNDRHPLYGVAV